MTDTDLSRWIVEKVFKECWHEWQEIERGGDYSIKECTCGTKVRINFCMGGNPTIGNHIDHNPNICTPDGSAMLKAKAQELGVWEHFATVCLWNYCQRPETISKGYHNYLTTPRLMCEAFRAYWVERGK